MGPKLEAEKKAVVLDTSALVAGFDPFSIGEEQYTPPAVIEEASRNSVFSSRLRAAVENGKVIIKAPSAKFLEEARASASAVGDSFFLSETDVQILALALELKREGCQALVATDDYSIQNVANHMKIEFAPLATLGIRRRLQWVRYCPACYRRYNEDYRGRLCKICGTRLKRKPVKENLINRWAQKMEWTAHNKP